MKDYAKRLERLERARSPRGQLLVVVNEHDDPDLAAAELVRYRQRFGCDPSAVVVLDSADCAG